MEQDQLKSFTVKRSRWLTGSITNESVLYRPSDRRMCCVGFACRTMGYKVGEIADKASYSVIKPTHNERFSLKLNDIFWNAYTINDDNRIDDRIRENSLQDLFAKHGIELKFVD